MKPLLFSLFSLFALRLGAQIFTPLNDFDNKRFGSVSFVVGGNAYVGLGRGALTYSGIKRYEPGSDSWVDLEDDSSFPGLGRVHAVSFVLNGKAYVGLGEGLGLGGQEFYTDFYAFDPSDESWEQVADFPGTPRTKATSFVAGGFAYVGTGLNGTYFKDFWRYDASSDTWTQVADLNGEPRHGAVAFSINGKGYVASGGQGNTTVYKDLQEYNPATDTWTTKIADGGDELIFEHGTAFVLNNQAYLCYGVISNMSAYNPSNNTVTEIGDPLQIDFGWSWPISFVLDNEAYFGLGCSGPQFQSCDEEDGMWVFDSGVAAGETKDKTDWKVLPSPSTGSFRLFSAKALPVGSRLEVFAMDGSRLRAWDNVQAGQTFDDCALPKGICMVRLSANEVSEPLKLVVQ